MISGTQYLIQLSLCSEIAGLRTFTMIIINCVLSKLASYFQKSSGMLNKNTLYQRKKCEANQKQHCMQTGIAI